MRCALLWSCLLAVPGWHVWGDEVFVRKGAGAWRTLGAERHDGTLTVRISAEDTEAGRALLVLGKPDWMTLDDAAAPVVSALSVDGQPVEVGERLEIRTEGEGPRLQAVLDDGANPLRHDSLMLALAGRTIQASDVSGEPLARTATASFDLSSLGPGVYEGALMARDMAPTDNALRLPVRVVVDGMRRHVDAQAITVCRAGHEYVVGPGSGHAFVRLGSTGATAYLSTEVNGKFVYARRTVGQQNLPESGGLRLKADVIGIDDQDFGQIAELEFDLETAPQSPALLVTSRARNLSGDGDVYCFWGWLPGSGYVTADGEHAWTMTYAEIGAVGWVFLRPERPGQPGIGVLTDLPFGESRFGTLLIYTDPKRIHTVRGDAVEMRLAFMMADGPQAVAEAYETLTAMGWLGAR